MVGGIGRLLGWVAATLCGVFVAVTMVQLPLAALRLPDVLARLPDPLLIAAYFAAFCAGVSPGFAAGALQALALPVKDATTRVAWIVVTGVGAWAAAVLGAVATLSVGGALAETESGAGVVLPLAIGFAMGAA